MLPPTFSAESFPLISSAATLPPTAETLTFVPLETATLFVMSFAVTSFSATDIVRLSASTTFVIPFTVFALTAPPM